MNLLRLGAADIPGVNRCSPLTAVEGKQFFAAWDEAEELAGDLAAILDAMAIERAAIVGHSLGGFVALAFARMYTERVTRLALICSRLAADSPEIAGFRNDLADRLEQRLRHASLADRTGLSKSSVHRHLQAIDRRDRYPESSLWETEPGRAWLIRLAPPSEPDKPER